MCVSRWFLIVFSALLASGAALERSVPIAAAASTSRTKQATSRVKAPAKLPKVSPAARPVSPPRFSGPRAPQSASLAKKSATRSSTAARSAPKVAARPTTPAQLSQQGSAINQAKLRSKLNASRLTDVSRVADRVSAVKTGAAGAKNRPGQVGSTSNNSFSGIANRAKAIGSKTAEQAKSANSSTLRGLENVMPGFRNRASGGSSLRDLAGGSAGSRNPVTTGSSLSNFAGGGSGKFSDGSGVISAHKKKNGDIVITKENGDIVTRYKNGDRGVNKENGDTEYTFAERKVVGTPTPPIEPIDYGAGNKGSSGKHTGGKQGSQKEPTPDDTTDTSGSGSVPRYVSGAQLRGLASQVGSRGEPTGDEATGGGPVDKSKTREGRNAQVGEPVDDVQASTAFLPDQIQIKQALQVRLRNVTPIPHQ